MGLKEEDTKQLNNGEMITIAVVVAVVVADHLEIEFCFNTIYIKVVLTFSCKYFFQASTDTLTQKVKLK